MTRLADLEAQMEFQYVKHLLLIREQQKLKVQYEFMATLPVGVDAFKDDLERVLKKENAMMKSH